MTEPLSTGAAAASTAVTGITLVSLFGPLDGPTVIGAFAGASIFIASVSVMDYESLDKSRLVARLVGLSQLHGRQHGATRQLEVVDRQVDLSMTNHD